MDNLGEQQQVQIQADAEDDTGETSFGGRDDPNKSIAIMTGEQVDEILEDESLDEQIESNSFFNRIGVFSRREVDERIKERKEVLSELGININQVQGDEFSNSRFILDNSRVIKSKKSGKPIGIKFDGVQITGIQKGGRITYSKDQKVKTSVDAFKELARKANNEHQKTLDAMLENISIEENKKTEEKIEVTPELIELVTNRAIRETNEQVETLEEESYNIRNHEDPRVILTENEIREMNGAMVPKGSPDMQVKFLKELAKGWRERAKTMKGISNSRKIDNSAGIASVDMGYKLAESLYETQAKICELKADNIQLKRGLRVTSQEGINIVKKIFKDNDYTRLERFKVWAKNNMVGLAGIGITVASIITSVILYARNSLTGVADGVKKVASALKNVAEKIGSSASDMAGIIAPIISLLGTILSFLALGVKFLSENLWILAVAITYWLYEQYKKMK